MIREEIIHTISTGTASPCNNQSKYYKRDVLLQRYMNYGIIIVTPYLNYNKTLEKVVFESVHRG